MYTRILSSGLLLAALTAAEPQAQQITIPQPKTESTIRSVALDGEGKATAEGQAVLTQMSVDGWRSSSMTALTPTTVAVLFTRNAQQAKPAAPPTPSAAPPQTEATIAAALVASSRSAGLQATASGLRYEVVRPGGGRKPGPTDQVVVRYTGAKLDGTVFDASSRHGGTAQFGLHQVIKGWTEGLQLMQEGAVYRFVIPAELAYGRHAPPEIGVDQTLLFEVELVSVR